MTVAEGLCVFKSMHDQSSDDRSHWLAELTTVIPSESRNPGSGTRIGVRGDGTGSPAPTISGVILPGYSRRGSRITR
jgi:hypothetical protein